MAVRCREMGKLGEFFHAAPDKFVLSINGA